jgi:hypothetical protein
MVRTVSHTWARGKRVVRAGGALRVKGIKGQVRFRMHTVLDDGREFIDVVHPVYGFYAVRPDRIISIPYTSKLREKVAA